MITKWNRESLLVTVMAVMILVGIFVYGTQYLIDPVKSEAVLLNGTVEQQQNLLSTYPPSEELKTELEETYLETESYLPLGDQATKEFVRLEQLANQANVSIRSISRVSSDQAIEDVPDHFVKTAYTVQVTSELPTNFRNLIDRLMDEDRVWNIMSFTYDKSGDATYNGTFTYELPYFNKKPLPEETLDEMNDGEEISEEADE